MFLGFLPSVASSGQINPIQIQQNTDWEIFHKKIPVSGEIRTGLVVTADNKAKPSNHFYVQIPQQEAALLCVEISSNDGRYSGKLTYDIDKLEPGIHQFQWPTKFWGDLKKFTATEITILSWIGSSRTDQDKRYVLSSWASFDSMNKLTIILNSERKPQIYIRDTKKNSLEKFDCQRLEGQPNVAYNCLCHIPVDEICKDCEVTVVQRTRRGRTYSFNRYPMPIKL